MISLALALAVDVLDVDANQGPFFEISAAIGAASSGDVIRIAPGSYGFFQVQGKSLSLLPAGAGQTYTVDGTVRISGIPDGDAVVLRGAQIQATPSEQQEPAILVSASPGSVRAEDCIFQGGNGVAGRVLGSADVSFHDCLFQAATTDSGFGLVGYDGVRVEASAVSLWSCTVIGTGSTSWASPGGHGVLAEDSQIVLQDGWIEAGDGGPEQGSTLNGCTHEPSPGGDALRLDSCDLQWVGSVFQPGDAGFDEICSPGVDGLPINAVQSTVTALAGEAPVFDVEPALVFENQPLSLTVEGEPGDGVFLLLGPETGLSVIPGLFGNLAVDGPPTTVRRAFLGSVPLTVQIQSPSVAALATQSLTLQTLHLRPGSANLFGPVRMVTVLDEAL